MSDVNVQINSVSIGSGTSTILSFRAGETILPGDPYYLTSTSGVVSALVAANTGSATSLVNGLAYTSGEEGDTFLGMSRGALYLGTPLNKGATYYLSDTSGICEFNHVTGYLTQIGWAQTTGELAIDIKRRNIYLS